MKNIQTQLFELLSKGFCTPKLSMLAKKIREPATTLHYNIKKLESEGKILAYKAIFDFSKMDKGLCTFVMISIEPTEYNDPIKLARQFTQLEEVDSVAVLTGDWEIILKVRTKNMDEYYKFVTAISGIKGIHKIKSINALKEVRSAYIDLP